MNIQESIVIPFYNEDCEKTITILKEIGKRSNLIKKQM